MDWEVADITDDGELGNNGKPLPREIDEDAAYERYRDNAHEDLTDAFNAFVKEYATKKGYYHNMPDKIKQHLGIRD